MNRIIICPKCKQSTFVKKSLPRDCHPYICTNHEQDLFFGAKTTPKLNNLGGKSNV